MEKDDKFATLSMEFCPIGSVKAIFGKTFANVGSLKCDPFLKHLFL